MKTKFIRKFTEEERVALAEEALRVGSNTLVALKYDINPNLLSRWKTNYQRYGVTISPKDLEEQGEVIEDYKKAYKKLKKELSEKELEIAILRDLIKKKSKPKM